MSSEWAAQPIAVLAKAWVDGDGEVVAEIRQRLVGSLLATAWLVLGDQDAAEDVVERVLRRAATELDRLEEPDRLRAWLMTLLVSDVAALRPAPVGPGASVPVGPWARRPLAETVQAAAASLDAGERHLLELHLYARLGVSEVAAVLDVSLHEAAERLGTLRRHGEQAIAGWLLARFGRVECERLAAELAGWDGRYTVEARIALGNHAMTCSTCLQRWTGAPTFDELRMISEPLPSGPIRWAWLCSDPLMQPIPAAAVSRRRMTEPPPVLTGRHGQAPRRRNVPVVTVVAAAAVVAAALAAGRLAGDDPLRLDRPASAGGAGQALLRIGGGGGDARTSGGAAAIPAAGGDARPMGADGGLLGTRPTTATSGGSAAHRVGAGSDASVTSSTAPATPSASAAPTAAAPTSAPAAPTAPTTVTSSGGGTSSSTVGTSTTAAATATSTATATATSTTSASKTRGRPSTLPAATTPSPARGAAARSSALG